MQGVPGRKSLVWVAGGFGFFDPPWGPPVARGLLGQANIAVYPVMVRSIMSSGMGRGIAESQRLPPPPGAKLLDIQYEHRKLGESLGGAGFTDAARDEGGSDGARGCRELLRPRLLSRRDRSR
jgi:hypothetical protein